MKKKETKNETAIAVDLGLPSGTLWSDRNVGAKSPQDDGAYFSWGNTEPHFPKEQNDWGYTEDVKDGCSFDSRTYEKTVGAKLKDDIDLEHDAAHAFMGGDWHMPTSEQFRELYDYCAWERKTIEGVNGYLVTSMVNGNSIFFPAAGFRNGTGLHSHGSNGYYWSSSLYSSAYGYYLHFNSGGVSPQNDNNRFYGFSVRAVQ